MNSASPPTNESVSENRKILVVLAAILLVTIVPYLIWGPFLDEEIPKRLMSPEWTDRPFLSGFLLIGLLVADIFLPIPSSFVCTWSGAMLGLIPGTLVNWLGLNLSAAMGYFMARRAVAKLASATHGESDRSLGARRWFLAFFRGLPVLAEGSVLLAGARKWEFQQIWFPVVVANFLLAASYAALGFFALAAEWLGSAIILATALPALPLAVFLIWKFSLPSRNQKETEGTFEKI